MSEDIEPSAEDESQAAKPLDLTPKETTEKDKQPEAVRRAIRKMSEGVPDAMVEMTAMMGMMGNPIHQKMTEGHITKMLDLSIQHDKNEFELRQTEQKNSNLQDHVERVAHLICFLVFISLVVFILWVFKDQPNVLVPILAGVGGIVTGFMGGMGYANWKKHRSNGDE